MPLRLTESNAQGERFEWKVCEGYSRHRLSIQWDELEGHNLPYEREIEYEYRIVTWFFLVPVALGKGKLVSKDGMRSWNSELLVSAGRLLTRYVEVSVPDRQDPPNRQRFWLIPRASVWCSLALVLVSLVAAAVLMATTLSTLHVNLTYSHAVTGLGGLTLLAVAGMVFRTISPDLRGHRPPLLGLGYVLGRTLVVCVLGGVLVSMVPTHFMTSVVNETQAKVELWLPSSAEPLILGPGQRVTFFGTADSVSELLSGSLAGEAADRFCLIDAEGNGVAGKDAEGKGAEGKDAEGKDEQAAGDKQRCVPSSSKIRVVREPGWASRLQPTPLTVRCRKLLWEGLDVDAAKALGSTKDPIVKSEAMVHGGEGEHELELDDQCKPKHASQSASVTLGRDGYTWSYDVEHPWRLAELHRATRLVVDTTGHEDRDALKLQVVGPASTAAAAGQPAPQGVTLRVEIERAGVTRPLPLPHPRAVGELSIAVGTPDSDGLVQRSLVTCKRSGVGIGSHFRLQQLWLAGSTSRLLALDARASEVLGWESSWVNTLPGTGDALAPWICATAVGEGAEGEVIAPTDLGDVALTLQVDFPHRDEGWALRIPAVYVGRKIEIKAQSGGLAGSLTCSPSATALQFAIGPLWVSESGGGRVRAPISWMVVERQGDAGSGDRDDGKLGAKTRASGSSDWSSTWELEGSGTQGVRGEFPPWTCRPVTEDDDGCLGCGRASAANRATAQVTLGNRGAPRSARVDLATSQVTLERVFPTPCYFDEHYSRRLKRCPAPRCKPVTPEQRTAINRDLGQACPLIIACPPPGARCPD